MLLLSERYNLQTKGFSLIELMIVIAIIGIVSSIAFPSFAQWIQDSRIRTVAETLQNSLRLAQTEAVKNSTRVSFFLTNADPTATAATSGIGLNWGIRTFNNPTMIQMGVLAAQGGNLAIATVPSTPIITFNSIGRLAGSLTAVNYQITGPAGSRNLNVQVSTSGGIRMCDPAKTLSADNPDGC